MQFESIEIEDGRFLEIQIESIEREYGRFLECTSVL